MVNQFQEYVNKLLHFLQTLANFSKNKEVSYLYNDFSISSEQQETFLKVLIQEGVLLRLDAIRLYSPFSSFRSFNRSLQGRDNGDGWKFKIDKDVLSKFLTENKHISITDKQEIFFKPKLSADGKTLIINGEEIQIISSNSTSKELSAPATLAKSLFTTEELYVSKQDFAKELTGDTELNTDINKRIRNAVYYLNKKIYTETKLDKYIRVIDGEISISPQYIEP